MPHPFPRRAATLAGATLVALLAAGCVSEEDLQKARTERDQFEAELKKSDNKLRNAVVGKQLQELRSHIQMLAVILDNADTARWAGKMKGMKRPADYNPLYGDLEEMAKKNGALAKHAANGARDLKVRIPADVNETFAKAVLDIATVGDDLAKLLDETLKQGPDPAKYHERIEQIQERFRGALVVANDLSKVY